MSAGKANCAICGEPLVYTKTAQELTCYICGKKEWGNASCSAGHFVCDSCHRTEGVDYILDLCSSSTSKNPVEIMTEAMNNKTIYPNGPEHHTLIGASLITAFANAGGKTPEGELLNKDAALAELKKRSLQVPGGTCGFWGTCGGATSAGQAMSILNGSTPLTEDPWTQCQRLTSMVLGRLADIGGPRCCKRAGFVALITAVPYINELLDVSMELPDEITCSFFNRNPQCKRNACPFFPNADECVRKIIQPQDA